MTSTHPTASPQDKRTGSAVNPKVAVPILLFVFVFSLVIDNGFKTMTMPIAEARWTSPLKPPPSRLPSPA